MDSVKSETITRRVYLYRSGTDDITLFRLFIDFITYSGQKLYIFEFKNNGISPIEKNTGLFSHELLLT